MNDFTDPRLAGLAAGEVRTGPQAVHLDVTNACNADCLTCWDHSPLLALPRAPEWKRRRVEAGAFEALLDDIRSLGGLEAVILSGMGEPLVHPEICRLIEAVKRRGLRLTILTNLIPAGAERILALEVDELLIGIHAATEAAYRAFHPSFRADEWARLHRMLARLAGAGRRTKHVQVICRTNAEEVPAMIDLAHRYGARQVNFKLASLRGGTEACRITEEQRVRLREDWVPEAEERAGRLGVAANLDVFAAQLEAGGGATARMGEVGCFMGHYYARILVDGTVLYCCNTGAVVGSLAGGARFSDLWNGARWNELRARMRRGRYLPSCERCGKLNQNLKIERRFAARYGEERLLAITGRAGSPSR